LRIPCRSSPRPARLHVIDTLRGVQVGGDPSRAETRRGRWSHGSPSAPTSAGRAGKSFLRKPREMSRRTAAAALSTDGAWAGGARRVGRSGECEGRGNGRGRRSEAPKNGGECHHTPAALISAPAVELARARITVPRAKRLLQVAAAAALHLLLSGRGSRSTLMRQPAPSSAWKSWLRRPIARPTCQRLSTIAGHFVLYRLCTNSSARSAPHASRTGTGASDGVKFGVRSAAPGPLGNGARAAGPG